MTIVDITSAQDLATQKSNVSPQYALFLEAYKNLNEEQALTHLLEAVAAKDPTAQLRLGKAYASDWQDLVPKRDYGKAVELFESVIGSETSDSIKAEAYFCLASCLSYVVYLEESKPREIAYLQSASDLGHTAATTLLEQMLKPPKQVARPTLAQA